MGAISQAQVQLLVTARSEAQAVMNQTATSVKTVTDAVAKNTELMGGAEKQQRLLEEAVERSRQAQESWARQVRIAAGEIAGLTDTEKQAIQNAKELAISNETVAATLGISTAAVKAYQASLRTKNDTEEESKKKSSGLGLAIGGTVATIGAAILGATSYADRLGELSDQTGIGVEALQKFGASALTNGSSLEKLTSAYGFFQNSLEAGSKNVTDALNRLGIDFELLKQQSPEEQMRTLATAVTGIEDPLERSRVATELFRGAGRGLIPTLADIAANYDKLPAVSEDLIAKTGRLADTVDLLKQTGQGMLVQFLAPLLGNLQLTTGHMTTLLSIVPNLQNAMQVAFAQIALSVHGAEQAMVGSLLAVAEFEAKIPGFGAGIQGTVDDLRRTYQQLDTDLKVDRDTIDFLNKSWIESTKQTKAATLGNVEASGTVVSLAEKLKAARDAVAGLSDEQKNEINAGLAMHESAKAIVDDLNKQYPALHFTADALKVYEDGLKASAKAAKENDAPAQGFQRTLGDLALRIEQATSNGASAQDIYEQFGKELIKDSNLARILGIDVSTISTNLEKAMEDAHAFNLSEALRKNDIELQKQLSDIINKRIKEQQRSVDATNEIEVKGNEQAFALAQQYSDARAKLALTGADYQIYQADRWMAVEKAKLDTRSTAYQTNVDQIEAIHALMVAQVIKQTDPMFQMWGKLKDQVINLGKDINDDFSKMLTGAESFHDGFNNIWDSIKKTATNILGDILEYFEKIWIAKMTAALLGGGSVWGNIIQSAIGHGFQSGMAQGFTNSAGQVAAGAIANNAGTSGANVITQYGTSIAGGSAGLAGSGSASAGTSAGLGSTAAVVAAPAAGALVGGIVGWKVGRATGNWELATAAGAGSGAATGAAVGSVVPGAGTAVGAGVGAAVGAIAGAWAAHKANEDARDQMVAIRAELEKTFGSLDNVRKQAQYVGVDIDKAFAQIGRGVQGTKEFNAVVDEFQKKWNDLDGAMKRYGITIDDIQASQKSQAELVADQVKQLQDDYTALTGTGGIGNKDTVITKMAGAFNDLLVAAKSSGTKIPASLEPILDRMNELGLITDDTKAKLLGLQTASSGDLQKASEVAQKYGITLAQLGPQFQQAQISARAQEIIGDFTTLKGLNVDIGGSLAGMSDEISKFVQDAIQAGAEVPDSMRDILQELINNKQLIDANGQAFTDLTQIKFGAPVANQFQPVTDAIHELIDVLKGNDENSIAGALRSGIDQMQETASKTKIKIPYGFESDGSSLPGDERLDLPHAAKGILATGQAGVATWFGEGGQPELGGPRDFMTAALQGVDWTKVQGFQGGDGGKTINITIPVAVAPGTSLQGMMSWWRDQAMPALLKYLDNDGSARVNVQTVLGLS